MATLFTVRKTKKYLLTKFPAETIKSGIDEFLAIKEVERQEAAATWSIDRGAETWEFNTEDEFFAEYRSGFHSASLSVTTMHYNLRFSHSGYGDYAQVSVEAPARPEIEKVFWPFERDASSAKFEVHVDSAPASIVRPIIFIGHGRSTAWRDLKDHLVEQHGYLVQAYETGARSGHTIRDILEEMLQGSSFALLVLTGEDTTEPGEMRARQNVVHELGLFQGKLGFPRAIAVVEEGIELFSNMDGVQQIKFRKAEVRQVFGDVLAVLRREFGDSR